MLRSLFEVELDRYPRIEMLRAELQAAGFTLVNEEHVEQPFEVTSADAYRARAFSSLHFISEEALAKGLDAMESDLQRGPIQGISRYTLLWARAGDQPDEGTESNLLDSDWSQAPLF